MSKIKLIISDIDGTLVDRTEQIPPELIAAVRKCRDAGIVFALATGRTTELAEPFVRALEIDAPCIEANGAYILRGGKCLAEHGFSAAPIREILEQADQLDMTVTLSNTQYERAVRETAYVRYHQSLGNRFQQLLPFSSIDWERDRFQKIMIMDEARSGRIQEIRERLEPFSGRFWITTFSDKAVELGPKGCNKATGMEELATLLDIDLSQVMACGDYRNDFEMITRAGYGVAVDNALPEIKAAADYVASKPYALGVVEAMEVLCFR